MGRALAMLMRLGPRTGKTFGRPAELRASPSGTVFGPHGRFGRLVRDRSAIGAVEFALIAPFLLILYMAGSEISIAVTINRKVQHTASTVNDLITQSQELDAADIDGIFNIAAAIVEPYDSSKVRIRVTQVKIDADGKQTVDWSRARGTSAAAKDQPFPLPSQFASLREGYVMVSETWYDYIPIGGYGLKEPIEMGERAYLNPRIGNKVVCGDC